MSYLRYLCLFGSSLPPVVCRRTHVLFIICVCLVRLYLQLFVGGLMSYLRYLCLFVVVWSLPPLFVGPPCLFVGGSSLPVLFRRTHFVCLVRLYLQLFVGGLMSYLRYFVFVWFVFTSSCL